MVVDGRGFECVRHEVWIAVRIVVKLLEEVRNGKRRWHEKKAVNFCLFLVANDIRITVRITTVIQSNSETYLNSNINMFSAWRQRFHFFVGRTRKRKRRRFTTTFTPTDYWGERLTGWDCYNNDSPHFTFSLTVLSCEMMWSFLASLLVFLLEISPLKMRVMTMIIDFLLFRALILLNQSYFFIFNALQDTISNATDAVDSGNCTMRNGSRRSDRIVLNRTNCVGQNNSVAPAG